VSTQGHPDFGELTEHFKLLVDGRITLNEACTDPTSGTARLFELLVALAVLRIGTDVEADDPIHSSQGTNPDVLANIGVNRWGFACKLLYSLTGKALHRAVKKGVDQIEKSNAVTGVVIVSLNNLLDYSSILGDVANGGLGWPTIQEPLDLMKKLVDEKKAQLGREVQANKLDALFRGKKAQPVIVLYTHAVTLVMSAVGPHPLPALLRFLSGIPLGDSSTAAATLENLNRSLQDIQANQT
jgi:hypothetical protein